MIKILKKNTTIFKVFLVIKLIIIIILRRISIKHMQKSTLRITGNKVVLNNRERMCETADELLASEKFRTVLDHCLGHLETKKSPLIRIFSDGTITSSKVDDLVRTLTLLVKYEANVVPHIFEGSEGFLKDIQLLNNFVEYLYDYWRQDRKSVV